MLTMICNAWLDAKNLQKKGEMLEEVKQAYQVLDARRFHIIDNPVILGKHTPSH